MEFNTIAIDGIARRNGMLYEPAVTSRSLPTAWNARQTRIAPTLSFCISNCDKITPGILMDALRLNIPAVFVSGGPREAGKVR